MNKYEKSFENFCNDKVEGEDIDNIQKLVDKEKPMKPIKEKTWFTHLKIENEQPKEDYEGLTIMCPKCQTLINCYDDEFGYNDVEVNYCKFCGQKIDWSE